MMHRDGDYKFDDGKEQPFPPRTTQPSHEPRFLIPAGTEVAILPVADQDGNWREWRTRKALGFERFERWVKCETGNFYEFRDQGWLLLVAAWKVKKRLDGRIK